MSFDQRGFYKETGKLLKMHRERANMTQGDVAKELDMPRATYANIESGRQRAPADVIWRLSIVFKVSIKTLLPEPKKAEYNNEGVVDASSDSNISLGDTSVKV